MGERKRGCGFRKIGGLYLVTDGPGYPCPVLPYALDVCPVCSAGVKFCRGWTWLSRSFFVLPTDVCQKCRLDGFCGLTDKATDKLGLLWVGKSHYGSTGEFDAEAEEMGISRRIKAIPKGFKLGSTWVALAHIEAVRKSVDKDLVLPGVERFENAPGVFRVFKPARIEFIVTKKMLRDPAVLAKIEKTGVTPVVVPDIPKHRDGKGDE